MQDHLDAGLDLQFILASMDQYTSLDFSKEKFLNYLRIFLK